MADVCSTCGLPKDLCVCGTISMEQQTVKVRMEMRKWGKPATIVEGIDGKSVDLPDLATKLKTYCACGGTSKNNAIILQGDHRDKVKRVLVGYGFPEASIELHQDLEEFVQPQGNPRLIQERSGRTPSLSTMWFLHRKISSSSRRVDTTCEVCLQELRLCGIRRFGGRANR